MFQRVTKSYPQENQNNDIFMMDNHLFYNGFYELSTDLCTGIKKDGLGVQFLHPPLVQKLHPNNIKFFNKKARVCQRAKLAKERALKNRSRFSRKKEVDFMDYQNLKRLNDIINCFLLECATLTKEDDDLIEKTAQMDGYEVYMICKRKED